jgi:hypothetical protein
MKLTLSCPLTRPKSGLRKRVVELTLLGLGNLKTFVHGVVKRVLIGQRTVLVTPITRNKKALRPIRPRL